MENDLKGVSFLVQDGYGDVQPAAGGRFNGLSWGG